MKLYVQRNESTQRGTERNDNPAPKAGDRPTSGDLIAETTQKILKSTNSQKR